jgi:hypothetical protein
MQCKGKLDNGARCRRKAVDNGYCKLHSPKAPTLQPMITSPVLSTGILDIPSPSRKNPRCSACGSHPVVCRHFAVGVGFYRCRECGHEWGEMR